MYYLRSLSFLKRCIYIEIDRGKYTGKTRIIERNDRHDHEIILKNFDSNKTHKLLAVEYYNDQIRDNVTHVSAEIHANNDLII